MIRFANEATKITKIVNIDIVYFYQNVGLLLDAHLTGLIVGVELGIVEQIDEAQNGRANRCGKYRLRLLNLVAVQIRLDCLFHTLFSNDEFHQNDEKKLD